MPPGHRREAATSPNGPVELPEAIWERIASHLSLRDWARASGTCQITSELQLQNIDVPRTTPREGMVWVTKRLARVERMQLRADCAEQLVLATDQNLEALGKLQYLLIETPEAESGSAVFVPMLAWLLSRTYSLKLLSATLGNISYFPPMSHLKHLILKFTPYPENGRVFESISHAVSLETLRIGASQLSPGPGLNLRLKNLKKLQTLALQLIRPTELQVWETCRVYVERSDVSCMSDSMWSNLAENVSYLKISDTVYDLLNVPASFGGFTNLQIVFLSLGELGKANASAPLYGLANVKRLFIDADNMFITVPAEVKWEEVWFGGHVALCITFADVKAFVASCSRFAMFYKSQMGTWMPLLCRSLAARGIGFEIQDRGDGRSILGRGSINFAKCFCGACLYCLPGQSWL